VTTIIDRNYVEKSDSPGTKLDIRKWTLKKAQQWPPTEIILKQTIGKETNKLQVTPLGRTVAEFIYKNYSDIFAYDYTSAMEQELDKIAKGNGSWTELMQKTWNSYKDRYTAHLSNKNNKKDTTIASNNTNKRELGQGISVILSKKGPLLINEEKEFASLPPRTSFESVTLEQALEAYLAKGGTEIGQYLDNPIKKKKGPYGYYAEWTTIKVPIKPDDTELTIIEKIKKKQEPGQPSFCRIVGDFTIKQGPYGLYFFKHTLKSVKFITFPKSADKEKVTADDMTNFYKTAPEKKKFIKKPKEKE